VLSIPNKPLATRLADPAAPGPSPQILKERLGLRQIIGESPALLEQIERVPRFARSGATVLISGESGTGKEVFARALHYLSPRAGRPFVPVNCGALPEHLIESEIFGHKRGAFTGALSDQAGLIGQAQGGTFFLDEVDTLTPAAQVKLLRVLQDGEYREVGGQAFVRADIRVIAATNANLDRLVSGGKFREDLFYRLNVLGLALPPLRDRRGDILLLADHILEAQGALAKTAPKKLSLPGVNRLLNHSWPGNIRELENVLISAVVLCDQDTIEVSDLNLPDEGAPEEERSFQKTKARMVRRFEHDFLETVLREHDGNITRAARAVKKNRRAFWELLRKHDLLAEAARE
jgi:two-component system response regulator GlrR